MFSKEIEFFPRGFRRKLDFSVKKVAPRLAGAVRAAADAKISSGLGVTPNFLTGGLGVHPFFLPKMSSFRRKPQEKTDFFSLFFLNFPYFTFFAGFSQKTQHFR